eukprot:8489943-Heterocapsa_arctica.AAC.1
MEEEELGGGPRAAPPYRLPPAEAYVGPAQPPASRVTVEPMDVDLQELFAAQGLSQESLVSIKTADASL